MSRLRPSGGYRQCASFQTATLIYDATVRFCDKFIDRRSRTVDQMVQAARSGRQNIAEGSCASASSSQTELRLTNVASASLEELLLDYEDYLRQNDLDPWEADSPAAAEFRGIPSRVDLKALDDAGRRQHYAPWLENESAQVRANALVCLIHQANFLLDRQIQSLEEDFVNKGGYSEGLAKERLLKRSQNHEAGDTDERSVPKCPLCESIMVLRRAKKAGTSLNNQFWGCSMFPRCKGTRKL